MSSKRSSPPKVNVICTSDEFNNEIEEVHSSIASSKRESKHRSGAKNVNDYF